MSAPPDLPSLWREHSQHRAASRAHRLDLARLSRSLALLLQARAHYIVAPLPFPRWLASVGIPQATFRSLLALLDPRPLPPAAVLADLQLTLRLTPLDSTVARRTLTALAAQPPGLETRPRPSRLRRGEIEAEEWGSLPGPIPSPGIDAGLSAHWDDPGAAKGRRPTGGGGGEAPGKDRPCLPAQIVAEAFFATTQGDLRHRLSTLRSRHPLDFDPAACAALPPLVFPATAKPGPLASTHDSGLPGDNLIRSLYVQFLTARRAHRREARQLSRRLPELGRLLALQQQQLAAPGRASRFGAWLRRYHIPRRTAYRLIAKFVPASNCAELEAAAPSGCPSAAPTLELHATSLTVRFSPKQAAMVHMALSALLQRPGPPPSLSFLAISALLAHLPASDSAPLLEMWRSSAPLPPARFLRPLQFFTAGQA